eukprot:CCRYP_012242-RA/>CCRYP_012242-RA protein AED:0.10 eAED:0.10 QI:0/0.84/0.75/1/0.73/0.55/20/4684/1413
MVHREKYDYGTSFHKKYNLHLLIVPGLFLLSREPTAPTAMDTHLHPPPRTPTQSPAPLRTPPSPHALLASLPPPPLPTTPRTPKKIPTAVHHHPSPGTPYSRHNPPPPPPKRGMSLGSSHNAIEPLSSYHHQPPSSSSSSGGRAARELTASVHVLASSIREPPFSTDDDDDDDYDVYYDDDDDTGDVVPKASAPRPPRQFKTRSSHVEGSDIPQGSVPSGMDGHSHENRSHHHHHHHQQHVHTASTRVHRPLARYNRANSVPDERTNPPNNDKFRDRALSSSMGSEFRGLDKSHSSSSSAANNNNRVLQLEPMERERDNSYPPDHDNDDNDAAKDFFHDNTTALQPYPLEESDTSLDNHSLHLYDEEDESVDSTKLPRQNANTWDRLIDSLLCIFPKVEPLPWKTFFLLSFWCALPPSGFITFFTAMGFGEQVYYAIADEFGEYAFGLGVGLLIFIFILYMLDADQWNSVVGTLVLDMSVLAVVAGFVLLVLLMAYQFPYGMVCLFALFNPLWLLTVKLIIYTKKDTRVFVSWLSGPLFTISVLIGLSWALWVFSEPSHQWNEVARINAASRSQCQPDYELFPDCRKEEGSDETCFYLETSSGRQYIVFPEGCSHSCTQVYNDCYNGFILWVGPVLVSMTLFFLSFFCTFFREDAEREKDIINFGKIWIFILFAMWVTASLSGTAAGVTSALAALTLASFVASAVFLTVSFSKEERAQNAAAVYERLREKYGKHLDVIRGLFIVTCAPFILIYFGFSIVNQFIRRTAIFPCSQPARGEDGQVDRYTARTRVQINMVKSWDRAKVYTYAVYWGIAFMVLEVIIAKLTVVFLSWLIMETSDFGLLIVTAIMWVAGAIMFLLPPVPGVPVYLTLGIVLPAQGHELLGWVGSAAYSILIGLLLKLFSSAIQQKVIGERLSHYVKVRQFVGINSTLMRAMRLVVGTDGLTISKVAILIGGPDWPTSVLCGIMRLSLPQILLGTVPVVFLTIPTCVTGTFLYMASMEADGNPVYPWARTLSTITASFTAIVQFGSMIVAAYYLERAADKRVDEIESIPIDEEVKEADEKAEHLKNCYREVTQWVALPWFAKWYLRISLGCIVTSSYMVQLFSSLCFTPYSLTDSIDENLNGNAANLFLPLGWVAVSLFMLSCVFLILFQRRGHRKARMLANGATVAVLNDELASSRRRSSLNSSSDPRLQRLDVEQYSNESSIDPTDVVLSRSMVGTILRIACSSSVLAIVSNAQTSPNKETRHHETIQIKNHARSSQVTQWVALPLFAKWYLRISLGCIVTSSYMVQLFSSLCFTPYSLTDSIDENLNGNAANLFLPLGWVAVSLFMLSCVFLILFQRRGHRQARMLANGATVAVLNDELASSRRRSSLNSSSDPRLQRLDVEQYSNESSIDPTDVVLSRSMSFSSRF